MADDIRWAELLATAEHDRVPIPPLSEGAPSLDIAGAYAIQRAGLERRIAEGRVLVGRKVGLTSAAMQEMLGVDQPDLGYLLDDMVHETEVSLPREAFIAPRVEGEIAFRLAIDLGGPEVSVADVLSATDAVAPAIEVIDSRIADWRITIVDTIADNASCGCAVVGDWRAPRGLDLASLQGTTTVVAPGGEREESSGLGAAVLGHPAAAVAWLARTLHAMGDTQLRAGEIVLPGAVSRALPVDAGSRATVSFDHLGDVEIRFNEEAQG